MEEASAMITDMNSTSLGFSSSGEILSELKNSEDENHQKTVSELVFSRRNQDFDSLSNYEEKMIEGEKIPATMCIIYRASEVSRHYLMHQFGYPLTALRPAIPQVSYTKLCIQT